MRINGLDISEKDLNQRYGESFIKIKFPDMLETVAYIRLFKGDHIYFDLNRDGSDSSVRPYRDLEIVQDFPEMGAVNHDGDVHFLTRNPLRQWSRGLSRGLISDFCRREQRSFRLRFGLMEAISCFNRVYYPLEEGLALQKKGAHSFAMSQHYWVSGKGKTYLWRDTICLGEIMGKKLFAFPSVCIMKDEVNRELGGCYEIE